MGLLRRRSAPLPVRLVGGRESSRLPGPSQSLGLKPTSSPSSFSLRHEERYVSASADCSDDLWRVRSGSGRASSSVSISSWWPQRDSNPHLGLERASPWVVISPTSTPAATARCHSAGSFSAGPCTSAVGRSTRARDERAQDFQSCATAYCRVPAGTRGEIINDLARSPSPPIPPRTLHDTASDTASRAHTP